MKQELLEKIDEKAAETQTELHNVVETLNKRLDKVENHTSELEKGVTANSDSMESTFPA